ncbi:hypothetical protein D5086_000956 [Populus alba]|uniref:Uncharacterized protein n=1 Tax=Populus alba TaxID=43335 RepID=A0ACC4CZG5_POPAL
MQIVREIEKLLGPDNKRVIQQLVDEIDELLSFHFQEDMHWIWEHVGSRSGADPRGQKSPLARRADRQTLMAKSVFPLESLAHGTDNLSRRASNSSSDSNLQPQATAQSVIAFMNHTRQLRDAVFKLEARGMNAAGLHGDLGKLGRTVRLGRKGPVLTICEEPEVFVVKKLQKLLGVSIPDASLQRASLLSLKSGETCGGLEVMDRSAYHNDEESDNRRGRENDDRLPDRCSFINLLDGQYCYPTRRNQKIACHL